MGRIKPYRPKSISILVFTLSFFVAVAFWGAMYEGYKYPHWSLMTLHMLLSHGLMGFVFTKEYMVYKRKKILDEWRKFNK